MRVRVVVVAALVVVVVVVVVVVLLVVVMMMMMMMMMMNRCEGDRRRRWSDTMVLFVARHRFSQAVEGEAAVEADTRLFLALSPCISRTVVVVMVIVVVIVMVMGATGPAGSGGDCLVLVRTGPRRRWCLGGKWGGVGMGVGVGVKREGERREEKRREGEREMGKRDEEKMFHFHHRPPHTHDCFIIRHMYI